jgi:hypothetical protein
MASRPGRERCVVDHSVTPTRTSLRPACLR